MSFYLSVYVFPACKLPRVLHPQLGDQTKFSTLWVVVTKVKILYISLSYTIISSHKMCYGNSFEIQTLQHFLEID